MQPDMMNVPAATLPFPSLPSSFRPSLPPSPLPPFLSSFHCKSNTSTCLRLEDQILQNTPVFAPRPTAPLGLEHFSQQSRLLQFVFFSHPVVTFTSLNDCSHSSLYLSTLNTIYWLPAGTDEHLSPALQLPPSRKLYHLVSSTFNCVTPSNVSKHLIPVTSMGENPPSFPTPKMFHYLDWEVMILYRESFLLKLVPRPLCPLRFIIEGPLDISYHGQTKSVEFLGMLSKQIPGFPKQPGFGVCVLYEWLLEIMAGTHPHCALHTALGHVSHTAGPSCPLSSLLRWRYFPV